MKAVDKLSENILDKLSIDFLRSQVLKNAYGNNDTVIAAMDPRVLIVWYLFFGLVPWFVSDLPFLLGCFVLVTATTILAHVAGLVLFLFGLGVFSQTGYLLVVTWLFGGDASAIAPLLVLTLKVATVSLASVTVFSGMDPDKLANGLMWFGCPEQLSFSISYAYRMLVLPAAGQPAGPRHPLGQDPLPGLPDPDHHLCLLSPDAQHGQAVPHHRRGAGNQGIPVRCLKPRSQKAQAGLPQGNE